MQEEVEQTSCMCLVFCGDYIIPYIGSVLLFYFGFSTKKLEFLGGAKFEYIIFLIFMLSSPIVSFLCLFRSHDGPQ